MKRRKRHGGRRANRGTPRAFRYVPRGPIHERCRAEMIRGDADALGQALAPGITGGVRGEAPLFVVLDLGAGGPVADFDRIRAEADAAISIMILGSSRP